MTTRLVEKLHIAEDMRPAGDPTIHRCKCGRWWMLLPVHSPPSPPPPPRGPNMPVVMGLDPGVYRHLATTVDDLSQVTTAELPWPELWKLQDRIDRLSGKRRGGDRAGR